MSHKSLTALLATLVMFTGCAQLDTTSSVAPERGDPDFLEGMNTHADQIYVNRDAPADGRDFRNVYIAPANLANMQVIQPEGAAADKEWLITESEDKIIQKAMADEFADTLSFESAYNIVESQAQAEIVINTAVVAIHPNETRSQVAAGAQPGGAITVSIAIIDAASGVVMVRSVDTRSSDDIWAFNQVDNDDLAINLIFRAWGNSIRRGMLQFQGRSNDSLNQPVILKEQK
jgi:hypothetical protein